MVTYKYLHAYFTPLSMRLLNIKLSTLDTWDEKEFDVRGKEVCREKVCDGLNHKT
jgi:hypothetical protein